jgi:hypothetical protein
MIKVKLTYPYPWPIIKQTPRRSGVWGNCEFFINQEIEECDFWVVFDGLQRKEETICPSQNTLLITAEPPSIKTYEPAFVNQFGAILTAHDLKHPNVIHSQQALNWMVGGGFIKETRSWAETHSKDYDELASIKEYKKTKLLSIVASNKAITKGHRERLLFIQSLKGYFGEDLDVFGVGFNEVADKWDAIYPYKYHIAIENSLLKNYWTEKLADAFLGGAYPIYYGCPNIHDYFAPSSLSCVNVNDIKESIRQIENIIDSNVYEKSTRYVIEAKDKVLNQYNLMAVLKNYCQRDFSGQRKNKKTILPEQNFLSQSRNYLRRIKPFLLGE